MLEKINSSQDVKNLNLKEKEILAKEIRKYILEVVSENGGHLASNLGVVELTIALNTVFDIPYDKVVWDVGHQSYVHKIIHGRREELKNIRKLGGIAGFPKTNESEADCFNTGHSSTSISAALGMARARDIKGEDNSVIAIIGDGALTGGMALEALNDAGTSKTNIKVILNDNEMSISKNIGGMSIFLGKLRTKRTYTKSNNSIKRIMEKIPLLGKPSVKVIRRLKRSIKQLVIPKMYFEDIGFTYLGPVDGHNIEQLEDILALSKRVAGPVLIHVLTKKGKGYEIAEKNPDKFHATSPFNIETGEPKKKKEKDFSAIFGEKLIELAHKNDKIVAITAAMKDGTGLKKFKEEFPKRFFDVGIAEQHAITLAAGMAKEGVIPVVPIYSSFYQRAYDQVIHDVAIQNLPVIMCVDRAGLVGADGETHQGMLDMAFFRLVPNLTIMAPSDFKELEEMLEFAVNLGKPVVIRYPRGGESNTKIEAHEKIEFGKAEIIKNENNVNNNNQKNTKNTNVLEGINNFIKNIINKIKNRKITIIAIGNQVPKAVKIAEKLQEMDVQAEVINARFLKPLDTKTIKESILRTKNVITIEDGTCINGLGTAIKELIVDENLQGIQFKAFAYPDEYIKHGTVAELEHIYSMDVSSILEFLKL